MRERCWQSQQFLHDSVLLHGVVDGRSPLTLFLRKENPIA